MIILIITLLSVPVGNIKWILSWLANQAGKMGPSCPQCRRGVSKAVKDSQNEENVHDARGFTVLKHSWLSIPFLRSWTVIIIIIIIIIIISYFLSLWSCSFGSVPPPTLSSAKGKPREGECPALSRNEKITWKGGDEGSYTVDLLE